VRTLLITGGAGFIGSALVRRLVLQSASRVVNLDKLTYAGNLESLAAVAQHPQHRFHQGDIADRAVVSHLLDEYQPSAVINLAAESHVDRSIDAPRDFLLTNVLGTFELLESVRAYWRRLSDSQQKSFRFLHVSTDEVFGSLGPVGAFHEETPYAPNSPYSASKASADHFVRAFHHTYGLPTLTTNCSNNYGPYQFPEKLIPLAIMNALEGRPIPIYGDGQNVRDWLYVEDHVSALLSVLDHGTPGDTYNIGGGSERTNLAVATTICATVDALFPTLPHCPCQQLVTFVPDRPGHDRRYAMDTTKIARSLNFQPQESFDSGLARTVRWYAENRTWVEHVTTGVYRRQRLGLEHNP